MSVTVVLRPEHRPARRVELPIGGEVIVVEPNGTATLPARYAGTHPRQVADALIVAGHLRPEAPAPAAHDEPHPYPCPTCGGVGWPCRTCGGSGELLDRGRR